MTEQDIDAGARAVYEAARQGIVSEAWATLPDWRKWRWRQAYLAAVAVYAGQPRRPARSVRVA